MIFIQTAGVINVQGLNFETARPRREILEDYCRVLTRIYDPVVFCARVERLIGRLKWTGKPQQQYAPNDFRRLHGIEVVQRIVTRFPEWRDLLWRTFLRCYESNPAAVRQTITLLSLFLHLGPYARQAIAEIEMSIADIDAGAFAPPPLVSAVPMAEPLVLSA
jgi:hypothetical protein